MPSPTDKQISDWEALNAYVDGMLPLRDAAEIAGRIAREPELARRAAAVSRMKASTSTAFDADGFQPKFPHIPTETTTPAPHVHRSWHRGLAALAAVAAVLIVAAVTLTTQNEGKVPGWLSAAITQHKAMSARSQTGPRPRLTAIASLAGFQPYIPDLSAARLHPIAAEPFRIDGTEAAIALHFRGTRGCKLSFVALSLPGGGTRLDETLRPVAAGGVRGYNWRVGDIGYLLIATSMDAKRLAVLAETIHSASRKHRPINDAARIRMAQSRANSRSCAT